MGLIGFDCNLTVRLPVKQISVKYIRNFVQSVVKSVKTFFGQFGSVSFQPAY